MSNLKPKQKRQARIIALQAIYARELSGSDLHDTCDFMMDIESPPSNDVINYGKQLSNLVFMYGKQIDEMIIKRSKNWDIDRITLIDKLILRISLTEMIYVEEVPPKVSITEGVEIAKQFSTKDSSSFINGILDSVYNDKIKENSV